MPNKLCEPPSGAQNEGALRLSRSVRFGVWGVLVVVAQVIPAGFALGGGAAVWAVSGSSLVLLAFLALLETTPSDAIRLPQPASVGVLWAGGLWCVVAAAGVAITETLASVSFVALVCFAVITPIGGRLSVWYAALVLWSPAVYAGVAVELFAPGWWALKGCVVATAIAMLAGGDRWRWAALAATLIAGGVIASVVSRLGG